MLLLVKSLNRSWHFLLGDKVIFFLSTFPVIIGSVLYFYFGSWIYGDVLIRGKKWIEASLTSGIWSSFFYYLLIALMTVGLFFIINWTFVLIVSLIASPFNDLISGRVERLIKGEKKIEVKTSFGAKLVGLLKIWFNEIKKFVFIIIMTLLSLCFSFIGLVPISFILSAIILAIAFVDYSWSRHDLSFKECLVDLKRSVIPYTTSGMIFLLLMSIPVVNLALIPFAVIHFTVLYTHKKVENVTP